MIRVRNLHFEGVLRAMSRRVGAAELPPFFFGWPCSVGVHRAVDEHGRHAVEMRLKDVVDVINLSDIREAFVVDDDIVSLCPLRILVEIKQDVTRRHALVEDGPLHLEGGMHVDHGWNQLSLSIVVMTAATGD